MTEIIDGDLKAGYCEFHETVT